MLSTIFSEYWKTSIGNMTKTVFGKMPRLKAGALLLIMVSAILLNFASPAMAGVDPNGNVNWCGTWKSEWSSPTGKYKGPITVHCDDEKPWYLWGTYENGDLEGRRIVHYEQFSGKKTIWFLGRWKRQKGHSGGPCPYGLFSLYLTPSSNKDNLAEFQGLWSYCNDKPFDPTKKSWEWRGMEEKP